jgi:hypothetical protein
MKKVLMIVCGAMLGIATMSQAQEVQDTASTNYNQGATEQTMDEPAVTDPTTQPTQDPTYAPTEEPALDQPTQDATSPTQDDATAPIQDDATSPTLDQSGQDGNNQIRQEQSRESGLPTEDQTDQSTEGNDGSAVDDTHGPK